MRTNSRSMLSLRALVFTSLIPFALNIEAQEYKPIDLFIPRFQSSDRNQSAGNKVSVILGLQIWRTYSTETRGQSSFDNANITYGSDRPPADLNDLHALALQQRNKPNLILWGRALEYGEGIVVEPTLIIPGTWYKNTQGKDIWSITVPTATKPETIAVDVPSRQYDFAPIVLDPNVLKITQSNTKLLSVYQLKSINSLKVGSFNGTAVTAIRHEGDWSRVKLSNTTVHGWVYLPQLTRSPSEVVNFCAALVRFLRNDWRGSVSLFEEVLKNDHTPTAIKLDSYLYLAMAYDRVGEEEKSIAMAIEAYKLNPYSKTATQFLFMSYLKRFIETHSKDPSGNESVDLNRRLHALITSNRILFSDRDEWLIQAQNVMSRF